MLESIFGSATFPLNPQILYSPSGTTIEVPKFALTTLIFLALKRNKAVVTMKISPTTMKLLDDFPVLIFEEVDPDQLSQVRLGTLSDEGVGNPNRLPYIRKWHVIFPSPGQVYATQNAHQVCPFFLLFLFVFCLFQTVMPLLVTVLMRQWSDDLFHSFVSV